MLLLVGALCGCISGVRRGEQALGPEPRYLDKPLSEWIPLTRLVGGDVLRPLDDRAASALAELRIEPELAVPELIKCLGHSDEHVRLEAMDALGSYGAAAQAAVPALTRIAETDSRSLEGSYAGNALKKIVPGTRP